MGIFQLNARTKLFMKSNLYGNIINLIHVMDLINHHNKTKKKKRKNLFSSFIYTLGGINLLPLNKELANLLPRVYSRQRVVHLSPLEQVVVGPILSSDQRLKYSSYLDLIERVDWGVHEIRWGRVTACRFCGAHIFKKRVWELPASRGLWLKCQTVFSLTSNPMVFSFFFLFFFYTFIKPP